MTPAGLTHKAIPPILPAKQKGILINQLARKATYLGQRVTKSRGQGTQCKQNDGDADKRLSFETLVSGFSARFINLPTNQVDKEIEKILTDEQHAEYKRIKDERKAQMEAQRPQGQKGQGRGGRRGGGYGGGQDW